MRANWVPLIAEVEWSSGGRGQERPLALRCGGARIALQVETGWTDGPADAGAPFWRVFVVRDDVGRRLRIRVGPDGQTRVEVAEPE